MKLRINKLNKRNKKENKRVDVCIRGGGYGMVRKWFKLGGTLEKYEWKVKGSWWEL